MSIKSDKIWMDGRLVDYEDAKIHVLTHRSKRAITVFNPVVEHINRGQFGSADLPYHRNGKIVRWLNPH